MTEPKPIATTSKWLVICHILWAGLLTIPFVIALMFPDHMIDHLFDLLLFELPEMNNPLNVVLWIILGVVNVLIILAVMAAVLIFRTIAIPVMILTCLPSVVGSVGEILKKKWGVKLMLVSGIFSLILIPFGTGLGVWTIVNYRRRRKQVAKELVEETQTV